METNLARGKLLFRRAFLKTKRRKKEEEDRGSCCAAAGKAFCPDPLSSFRSHDRCCKQAVGEEASWRRWWCLNSIPFASSHAPAKKLPPPQPDRQPKAITFILLVRSTYYQVGKFELVRAEETNRKQMSERKVSWAGGQTILTIGLCE